MQDIRRSGGSQADIKEARKRLDRARRLRRDAETKKHRDEAFRSQDASFFNQSQENEATENGGKDARPEDDFFEMTPIRAEIVYLLYESRDSPHSKMLKLVRAFKKMCLEIEYRCPFVKYGLALYA